LHKNLLCSFFSTLNLDARCCCCFAPRSVISGAFFFIRSLLQFVNNEGWAAGTRNGWILTAAFFIDAWLLGECHLYRA
jgi:hypothetical protein